MRSQDCKWCNKAKYDYLNYPLQELKRHQEQCDKLPLPLDYAMKPRLARLGELASARQVMIAYLKLKTEEDGWHAVSDAANDLRELDTEIKVLRELETDAK